MAYRPLVADSPTPWGGPGAGWSWAELPELLGAAAPLPEAPFLAELLGQLAAWPASAREYLATAPKWPEQLVESMRAVQLVMDEGASVCTLYRRSVTPYVFSNS